jgi:hypothetical protein
VPLHLHRGLGLVLYGTGTLAVVVLGTVSTVWNATSGRIIATVVTALGSLAVAAFLATVTHAMLWPNLTVTESGIRGRVSVARAVDLAWEDVTIDVDVDDPPGTLRLQLGTDTFTLSTRSWVGFEEFVLLVSASWTASERLTPAARREIARLFGFDE